MNTKRFLALIALTVGFASPSLLAQQNDPPDGGSSIIISISAPQELLGSKYRKVGLNGFPISEERPQGQEENDQKPEESYVDAFSLSLAHDNTDIYIPLPNSELALSVRRNLTEDSFTEGSQSRPELRRDRPFGASISSNLTPHIKIETTANGSTDAYTYTRKIYVTDESGAQYTFLFFESVLRAINLGPDGFFRIEDLALDPSTSEIAFIPAPSGDHQTDVYNATLVYDTVEQAFILRKKFGTTIRFPYQDISNPGPNDPPALVQTYLKVGPRRKSMVFTTSARASQVTDRYGYGIRYEYDSGNPTLIPDRMVSFNEHDAGSAYQTVTIERNEDDLVSKVIDPRGTETTYTYQSAAGSAFDTQTLASVSRTTMIHGASQTSTKEYTFTEIVQPDATPFAFRQKREVVKTYELRQRFPGVSDVTTQPFSSTRTGTPRISNDYYHINLTALKDARGKVYQFEYDLNYSQEVYTGPLNDSELLVSVNAGTVFYGFYPVSGLPNTVAKVTLPNGAVSEFNPIWKSRMVFSVNDSKWRFEQEFQSVKSTHILDAEGNSHLYTFTEPSLLEMNDFTLNPTVGHLVVEHLERPRFVVYKNMSVEHFEGQGVDLIEPEIPEEFIFNTLPVFTTPVVIPFPPIDLTVPLIAGRDSIGTESVVFTGHSSFSPLSVTDFYGNVTTYEYNDPLPEINRFPLFDQIHYIITGEVREEQYYPLPNVETRHFGAIGAPQSTTKYFAYESNFRVMQEIIDEEGRVTQYGIDSLGRRHSETIYENSTIGQTPPAVHTYVSGTGSNPSSKIQETSFLFDGVFKNFVAQRTLFNFGPLSTQVGGGLNRVTLMDHDVRGNVSKEAVDMNNNGSIDPGVDIITDHTYDLNNNRTQTIGPEIETVSGPVRPITTYEYDAFNRLTRITYPDNTTCLMFYDARSNKIGKVDENGHATVYLYDDLSRRVGEIRVMDPVAANHPQTVDAFLQYPPLGNPGDLVTRMTYNDINSVLSVTDPNGNVTNNQYDGLQRLTQTAAPSKEVFDPVAQTSQTVFPIATFEYGTNAGSLFFSGESFKPTRMVDVRGFESLTTCDALYRPIEEKVQYDLSPAGGNTGFATTLKEYDDVGNLTKITQLTDDASDAANRVTSNAYDGLNRLTQTTNPDLTTVQMAYASTGEQVQVTDERGFSTDNFYDVAGRQVKTQQPLVADADAGGAMARPEILMSYDLAGNETSITNPRGAVTTFFCDLRARRVKQVQPLVQNYDNNNAPENPTTVTAYDGVGNVVSTTDARNFTTTMAYDPANRLIATTQPAVFNPDTQQNEAPVIQQQYDANGNLTKAIAANGNETVNAYDSNNSLIRTATFPDTGSAPGGFDILNPDPAAIVVVMAYDEGANRTGVTDGNGNQTRFVYDGLNRNTAIIDAAGVSETFTFNALNKISESDGVGNLLGDPVRVTNFSYDLRNRLVAADFTTESRTRTYTYDASSNLTAVDEPGTLADVSNTYDGLNRLLTETSVGVTTEHAYDLAGNRITTTYAKGLGTERTLTNSYDALNRTSVIADNAASRASTYEYDLNGNIREKSHTNGDIIQCSFDALNRKTQTVGPDDIDGNPVYTYDLAYDLSGNLLTLTEAYSDGSLNLLDRVVENSYDGVNRLTREEITQGAGINQDITETVYTYDKANNRTFKGVTEDGIVKGQDTYTINTLNQIVKVEDLFMSRFSFYEYDAYGNRTFHSSNETIIEDNLSWDQENRLVTIVHDCNGDVNTFHYAYDYRFRRIQRDETAADGTLDRIIFASGLSVQEYSESTPGSGTFDQLNVEFIRGSDYGGGIGGILYSLRGSNASFYHYNGRGDVTALTDDGGNLDYQSNYNAFGQHGTVRGTEEAGSNLDRQRANTKEETPWGSLNEGFRYRDLRTGVFLSRDPLGFVDGPNLYTYVNQNPWTKFDPHGLEGSNSNGKGKEEEQAEAANQQNKENKAEDSAKSHTFELRDSKKLTTIEGHVKTEIDARQSELVNNFIEGAIRPALNQINENFPPEVLRKLEKDPVVESTDFPTFAITDGQGDPAYLKVGAKLGVRGTPNELGSVYSEVKFSATVKMNITATISSKEGRAFATVEASASASASYEASGRIQAGLAENKAGLNIGVDTDTIQGSVQYDVEMKPLVVE